jgi:hypothetical protein
MKKLKWWIKNDLKMWIFTLLMALGLMGQCQCIYRFINSNFEPNYKREMIYGFSALTGVGVVVGWIEYPDEPPEQK